MNIVLNNCTNISFQENFLTAFSGNLAKKVLIIASLAFGLLAACYVVSRYCLKVSDKDEKQELPKAEIIDSIEEEDAVDDIELLDPKDPLTKEEINSIAIQIIDNLHDCLTNKRISSAKLQKYSFSIHQPKNVELIKDKTAPLLVRFNLGEKKQGVISLITVLDAIPWHNLDKKWEGLTNEQWSIFSNRAICSDYETIAETHQFLRSYSNHSFREMNRFLRFGTISVLLGVLKHKTEKLSQTQLIDKIAKERFFACLCAAGSLKALPPLEKHTVVTRCLNSNQLPSNFLSKYQKGAVVTEESFFGTTLPEGDKFFGNIEYVIKLTPKSKGKPIEKISIHPLEKECLFPPRTSFKVIEDVQVVANHTIHFFKANENKQTDANQNYIIHLEEVEESA